MLARGRGPSRIEIQGRLLKIADQEGSNWPDTPVEICADSIVVGRLSAVVSVAGVLSPKSAA